ncbi:MAG: endonuclease/exonuclease/phosphatase family protein [Maritimibacter harenae]
MKGSWHIVPRAVAGLCLVLILAGYLGRLHPVGDTIAVFRLYFAGPLIVLGAAMLYFGQRQAGGLNLVVGLGVVATAGILPVIDQDPAALDGAGPVVTHYQKNLQFHNDDPSEVLDDVRARKPDIITFQEAKGRSANILDELARDYPAHVHCADGVGIAAYARWPMIEGTAFCDGQLGGMQVEGPDGPLWVLTVHLRWVYPYPNARQVEAMAPKLAALEGPKAVGGDFNVVPWAESVDVFARAADVRRVGRSFVTFAAVGGLLRVQIDHVLASGAAGVTERLPRLGSDHWGVWARYTFSDD